MHQTFWYVVQRIRKRARTALRRSVSWNDNVVLLKLRMPDHASDPEEGEERFNDNDAVCQQQWWMSTHIQTGGILQAQPSQPHQQQWNAR